MSTSSRYLGWTLAVVVAAVLGGCGGGGRATTTGTAGSSTASSTIGTNSAREGTGVTGHVTAGPTCPVQRQDHPCPTSPVAGRVEALDGAGQTIGRTDTDAQGAFALDLVPGSYTLRVVHDTPLPRCPDTPVTVTAGARAVADITCDTGIR